MPMSWFVEVFRNVQKCLFGRRAASPVRFSRRDVTLPRDSGHVSKYLVHWTSRKGDELGLANLSSISESCRLLLLQNQFFLDGSQEIRDKMVCFTDVPLWHSHPHCYRYGHFAVVFHKHKLMAKGAQPVFYFTHVFKRDMSTVYEFLMSQVRKTTMEDSVFKALHRHFYYAQEFSDGPVTDPNANYYEREWRLGEMSLAPDTENYGMWCHTQKLPPCVGRTTKEHEKTFFRFERSDVAFLVAPREYMSKVANPQGFDLWAFEDVVEVGLMK